LRGTGENCAEIRANKKYYSVSMLSGKLAPRCGITRGGISGNPREHTDDDQLISGARLLLDVVLKRLSSH
jgi:hypothetical protein